MKRRQPSTAVATTGSSPRGTATGAIEWPWEVDDTGEVKRDEAGNAIAQALSPNGIEHHYAPLALVTLDGEEITLQQDCRCSFEPIRICADGQ